MAVQRAIKARNFPGFEYYHSVLTAGRKLRLGGQAGSPSCYRVNGPLTARAMTKYLMHSIPLSRLSFKIPIHKFHNSTGPSGRAIWGVGLCPLTCWDCGFESHRGHWCLYVVSVVCCQVEVSATSWSLVKRSPTDCGASLCVIQKPREWGGPGPLGAVAPKTSKKDINSNLDS